MSRLLIAYFSRTGQTWTPAGPRTCRVGNTARAASRLEALIDAEVFKIEPADPYPPEWEACAARTRRELAENCRPPLRAQPAEGLLRDCRTLFLCYPNFWGSAPMPVYTFLQQHDWSRCAVLPLCTHGGEGPGRSWQEIAAACPGARVLPGLAVAGDTAGDCETDLRLWLMQNGVPITEGYGD